MDEDNYRYYSNSAASIRTEDLRDEMTAKIETTFGDIQRNLNRDFQLQTKALRDDLTTMNELLKSFASTMIISQQGAAKKQEDTNLVAGGSGTKKRRPDYMPSECNDAKVAAVEGPEEDSDGF